MDRIRRKILRYANKKIKGFRTEESIVNNKEIKKLDVNSGVDANIEKAISSDIGEKRSKSLNSSFIFTEEKVLLSSIEKNLSQESSAFFSSSVSNNSLQADRNKTMKTNSKESFISTRENEDDVLEIQHSLKEVTEFESDFSKKNSNIVRRKNLPVPKVPTKFSLLSMMRQVFGKDLSRISMPICLNEPISFIQRISEDLEYHELLSKACKSLTIEERVAYVTVFASSAFSSTFLRLSKPFNPLLGETFELTHRGFRFIAEQVMHHPPVAAYHAESDEGNWIFWGTVWSSMSFGPNSLTIKPQGTVHLKLKTIDGKEEEYYWNRPNCIIHNIIFGSTWLEWIGDINVASYNHSYRGKTSFFTDSNNTYSWNKYNAVSDKQKLNKRRNIVTGSVFNEQDQRVFCIEGQSDFEIQLSSLNNANEHYLPFSKGNIVWKCSPHPNNGDNSSNFFLTYMALELNEITDDYNPEKGANIPKTDSRFRPDQRLYESGDIDGAQVIKGILEEKQRKREKAGTSAIPRWFIKGKKIPDSQLNRSGSVSKDIVEYEWDFTQEYWNYKNSQSFSNLSNFIDIFGLET